MFYAPIHAADKKPTIDELSHLKYEKDGDIKKISIIKDASHKWEDITQQLAPKDPNLIKKLADKYRDNHEECLRAVLVEYFLNKKPEHYDNDWDGLLELLEDVSLNELTAEIKDALEASSKYKKILLKNGNSDSNGFNSITIYSIVEY